MVIGEFDNKPLILQFTPKEMNKTANIPVKCDKKVEKEKRFDIILTLISSNSQVRIGRNKSVGTINDSTGNDGSIVSIGDDMIE